MDDDTQRFEADLLASVLQMKAGEAARRTQVPLNAVAQARAKLGVSQSKFAVIVGSNVRTVQDWEQGRRRPSRAAAMLIEIAKHDPKAIVRAQAALGHDEPAPETTSRRAIAKPG